MAWRSAVAAIGCTVALAGAATAQDGFDPQGWAAKMQERMLQRQAERLGLSDAQREQFLAAYREYQSKLDAAEKARDGAIDKLLTAEQREKLAEQRSNPFGGFGPGAGGPRVSFGGPDGGTPAIESAAALAKKLGLDDDQRAKLDAIYADYRKAQLDGVKGMDLSDPEGMIERASKIAEQQAEARKKRDARIRELLNDEQRARFEKLAKKAEEAPRARFGLALGGPDGPVVLGGGEDGDPAEGLKQAQEMLKGLFGGKKDGTGGGLLDQLGGGGDARIKKDLGLSEDEAMVLWPIVEKIQRLQRDHRSWRRSRERELRKALADGTDAASQLAELRERESAHRAELTAARQELRELVTVRQEAVLVGHGILE